MVCQFDTGLGMFARRLSVITTKCLISCSKPRHKNGPYLERGEHERHNTITKELPRFWAIWFKSGGLREMIENQVCHSKHNYVGLSGSISPADLKHNFPHYPIAGFHVPHKSGCNIPEEVV
jgi:hypothetical protein